MSPTTLLVVLGNLLFVLACGAVGGRLARKAMRTRELPEMLMGVGLLLLVVGLVALGASGIGRTSVGEVKLPLLAVGLAMFGTSAALQAGFVSRTFRPGQHWARLLTTFLGAFAFAVMGRILATAATSPAELMSVDAMRDSVFWIRLPFAAVYMWTAIEGYQQYRMAQRRENLDIGDPVLTNRFMLWTGVGALACFNSILTTTLHAFHITAFNHPVGAASLGVGASLASIALLLVFMPPLRYIEWIRVRNGLEPI